MNKKMKYILFIVVALMSFTSCKSYYVGYGKGQAKHRNCGDKVRKFSEVKAPVLQYVEPDFLNRPYWVYRDTLVPVCSLDN